MSIAVCIKWVDQRPELDAQGVPLPIDDRFAGISLADRAALEVALRSGGPVTAITCGPAGADRALLDAAACGAGRLIRIDAPGDLDSSSVARAIAPLVADARVVWCGDYSTDRGTGSVPAFLAAELGVAQLLGLVDIVDDGTTITATRRLDGGRRELLRTGGRAVCSVEGSVAVLRRAGLAATLAAQHAAVELAAGPTLSGGAGGAASGVGPTTTRPYRPRARAFAPPAGQTALERVRSLVISDSPSSHGEAVTLEPAAAAARILQTLADWGYSIG